MLSVSEIGRLGKAIMYTRYNEPILSTRDYALGRERVINWPSGCR